MVVAHIYKITCTHCQKLYIGSTRQLHGLLGRLSNHRSDAKKYKSKFYAHMNEVGTECFEIDNLQDVDVETDEERYRAEQVFIDQFNSIEAGFNTNVSWVTPEHKAKQLRKYRATQKLKDDADPLFKEKCRIWRTNQRSRAPTDAHQCTLCHYQTSRLDALQKHLKSQGHLLRSDPTLMSCTFKCELCGYQTERKDKLLRHNRCESHLQRCSVTSRGTETNF